MYSGRLGDICIVTQFLDRVPSIRVEIFKNMKSEPVCPETESDSSSSDSYNDNEGSSTQDREDMQAHLPVFPPWFPVQALPVLVFPGAFSVALLRWYTNDNGEYIVIPCNEMPVVRLIGIKLSVTKLWGSTTPALLEDEEASELE